MMRQGSILLAILLSCVQGQDTYLCPDGWVVADIGGVVDCILVGPMDEFVTKQDAVILCGFHDGWLVDMDEGRGGHNDSLQTLHQNFLELRPQAALQIHSSVHHDLHPYPPTNRHGNHIK